jgi:hypothetical protein
MPLHRALQKGRALFFELNKLGPPQVGHFTCFGLDDGSLINASEFQNKSFAPTAADGS